MEEAAASTVENLVSEVQSLRARIQELEKENTRFSGLVADCTCSSKLKISDGIPSTSEECFEVFKTSKIKGGNFMPAKFPTRYVALKVMYFGQRYSGFASDGSANPTIESEIFKALRRTRLSSDNKSELSYTRCGRTDKGVSAVGQVISLYLRSKLCRIENGQDSNEMAEEVSYDEREIDYVKVLNRVLPNDIRVMGWCPVPADFHARFGCLSREYKYFIWRGQLDVSALQFAGQKLVGEHDFRNFCKMDAVNVHNYKRRIMSFEIEQCSKRLFEDEVLAVKIKGTAFLWHQVRCIVVVLLMIGQGLEPPEVIDKLLDINVTPRKPQYKMAPDLPLVLETCEFEGVTFNCSAGAEQDLKNHLQSNFQAYILQAAIFQEALLQLCSNGQNDFLSIDNKKTHVPLLLRPTEPSYEERQSRINEKAPGKI